MNVPVAAAVAALTPALIAEPLGIGHAAGRSPRRGERDRGALGARLRDRRRRRGRLGLGPDARPVGAAALLLGALVAIELRSDAPLVPFGIFRLRTLTGANAVGLLIGASLISMFFFSTLYLEQVLGLSAIETGLAYLPLALTVIVVAAIAPQLVTRLGFKPVLMLGMATIGAALVWCSQVSPDGGFGADVLGPFILAGAGLGLAMVPDTIAAMAGVRPQESGLASGLINTSQQIGGALGLAVLATIANSRTDEALARAGSDSASLPNALTEGFPAAFLGGAVLAALGIMLTLALIRGRDSRAHMRLGTAPGQRPASANV